MRTKAVLPLLLTSTLALGVGSMAAAGPADAATRPVTVKSLTATDIKANGGCRNSTIKVRFSTTPRVDDVEFEVEVWKGSDFLGSESLYEGNGNSRTGTYFWCNYEGVGKFRVKRLAVTWTDHNWDDHTFRDRHTTSFKVKQASRATIKSAKRTKRQVTVLARDRYYRSSAYAWSNRKGHYVYLQRQTATGWKSVVRAKTDKRGMAALRTLSSKRHHWRVYSPGSSKIWADASRTIRR